MKFDTSVMFQRLLLGSKLNATDWEARLGHRCWLFFFGLFMRLTNRDYKNKGRVVF